MVWNAYLWRGKGVDEGFLHKADDTLQDTLEDQVYHDIDSFEEGTVPSWVIDCSDDKQTLTNFQQWLESNNNVREGCHHMLIVDCASTEFYSRSRGDMKHDPGDYDSGQKKYARSIANAAVALLGKNRFKNTVIHEFGHTCLDEWYCPYSSADAGTQEHSCGGVLYKGSWKGYQITPMLIANEEKIPDDKQCVADYSGGDGFTTDITSCTKDAMDAYHSYN